MIKKLLLRLFNVYPSIMSFKEIVELTGLPIVTFRQGKRKLHFLLDTGSTDNVIDSNALGLLQHEMSEKTTTLFGLDNIKNTVSQCSLTLSYKDVDYPSKYLVRDMGETFAHFKSDFGVQLHGILGTKFFQEYSYVLDFKDLIAYSKR